MTWWLSFTLAHANPFDIDGDGFSPPSDCDDLDPKTHPGAFDIVGDDHNQDCVGGASCYQDNDDDGTRTTLTTSSADDDCKDAKEGKSGDLIDCNDANAGISPLDSEIVASGVDEDCDGEELCFADADDDGVPTYELVGSSGDLDCKDPGESPASLSFDCDDSDEDIHEGAVEQVGTGIDEDCDGGELCYGDADNDGARNTSIEVSTDKDCADADEALELDELDCNDADNKVNPFVAEIPGDGFDQDCDTDESCYSDADNDGYRTDRTQVSSDVDCADSTEAYESEPSNDCDDSVASVHPTAAEVIGDEIDQNCDLSEICYADADSDHARSATLTASDGDLTCTGPQEARRDAPEDCDDGDDTVHPGAFEQPADGADQDCDGREVCFEDLDLDGARSDHSSLGDDADCSDPTEALEAAEEDCDDADPRRFPSNPEGVGDGFDSDCDGAELCWADADQDGTSATSTVGSGDADCADPGEALTGAVPDCDDTDAATHPGAAEQVSDGVDQDCDGAELCWVDADGDGAHGDTTTSSADLGCGGAVDTPADCDDHDAELSPAAAETCDGRDNDCDDAVDFDGCDPDDLDTDGLSNADDAELCASVGLTPTTCPEDPDVDGDAVVDGAEVGGDPAHPLDTDGDGTFDLFDTDDDGDGVRSVHENLIECPTAIGASLQLEGAYWLFTCGEAAVYDFGSNDLSDTPDRDQDGVPNTRDTDDDGDGVPTSDEGEDDLDCDLVPNYLDADDADGPCVEAGEPADPDTDQTSAEPEVAGEGKGARRDGGGGCSHTPGPTGLVWGALALLALRRLPRTVSPHGAAGTGASGRP